MGEGGSKGLLCSLHAFGFSVHVWCLGNAAFKQLGYVCSGHVKSLTFLVSCSLTFALHILYLKHVT